MRALARALPLLAPGRSLRFAVLPPGEDPDSLIRGGASGAFSQILAAACPLSEMLWQTELNAGEIDTPERRADLERRVMAQAGLIADRTVQNEYRRFFRDRLFALGRPDGRRGAATGRPAGGHPEHRGRRAGGRPVASAAAAVVRPAQSRDSSSALSSRIRGLIDEWVEELAALDFPEPELDNLRCQF